MQHCHLARVLLGPRQSPRNLDFVFPERFIGPSCESMGDRFHVCSGPQIRLAAIVLLWLETRPSTDAAA